MQRIIKLKSDEECLKLFGSLDENIRFTEERFDVAICARGLRVTITGDEKKTSDAEVFLTNIVTAVRRGMTVEKKQLEQFIGRQSKKNELAQNAADTPIVFTYQKKAINPRSQGQKEYVQLMQQYDIIFSIGPAGTGKTYLAVAIAIDFLKKRKVSRIILTRPAVEAGESLGFLPGDMYAKINPYLRPLYDALYEIMGFDEVSRCIERGIIEIAPLAYMRGRTLNDSFIILDEAQNSTREQMKMFLTRLGLSSKCIVTGDITQIDLPKGNISGLVEVRDVLADTKGIRFCFLTEKDVVRHPLVKDIIKAYEKKEDRREKK